MNCDFYLYRAPAGSGPVHEWKSNHADTLGSAAEVRVRVGTALPDLRWHRALDEAWIAVTCADVDAGIEIILGESEPGMLRFVAANAPPSILCRLMHALQLTHCYDQGTGELCDPFAMMEDWFQLCGERTIARIVGH